MANLLVSNALRQAFCLEHKMNNLEELQNLGFIVKKKPGKDFLSDKFIVRRGEVEHEFDFTILLAEKKKSVIRSILNKFNAGKRTLS